MKRSSLFQWRNKRSLAAADRGSILFLAVAALAILTILLAGVSFSVSQEWKLASFVTDANTSYDYALSDIALMKEIWASRPLSLMMTLYDLRPRTMVLDGKTIEASFFDEEALVHLKWSDRNTLLRLPGISENESLVDAIIAAPIYAKEDLLAVKDMTADVYDLMKDLVTVYGDGRININTVSPEVLSVLGASQGFISAVEGYRAGEDGVEGTADDRVFNNIYEIGNDLAAWGLGAADQTWLQTLIVAQKLSVGSATVRCELKVKKGQRLLKNFRIVIDLTTGVILRWDEQ